MNRLQERELVKQAYPGSKWSNKVDRMTDQQVIAIFFNLKNKGRIK